MTTSNGVKITGYWRILCAVALLAVASCGGPMGSGKYKIGDPYSINGQWYFPKVNYAYDETGVASWYGEAFHGKRTANGEKFNMNKVSAAHQTLPLPSVVRVTNLENGRSLIIRINDRGPFARGRILDLSKRAAELMGFADKGTAMVRVQVLPEPSRKAALEVGAGKLPDFDPPPPKAAPSVDVTVETLRTPDGVAIAPGVAQGGSVAGAPPFSGITASGAGEPTPSPAFTADVGKVDDQVTLVPVSTRPRIFVQAGAFASYDNANRVRARLSVLGADVAITQIYVTNRPFFRVRVGPLDSVDEADRKLAQVIAVGIPEARIVID